MENIELFRTLLSKLKKDYYELSDQESSLEILSNVKKLEQELDFVFPETYIDFLKSIGLGAFENSNFELLLYDLEDLISFNIGEDKFEELEDYIIFAQDEGSYLYIFDKNNKLKKGKEAVFRVGMDALGDDFISYLAKDFVELFEILVDDKKLNENWLKDEK